MTQELSHNEMQAEIQLKKWRERSMPMFQFRNSYPKNNRKSTNGRRVQVVNKKQIRHSQ